MPAGNQVYLIDQRHAYEYTGAEDPDSELQPGEDSKRMVSWRYETRKSDTAQTQPAHVSSQHNTKGNGRGTDEQFKKLEPDDLIDQCGTSAAGEEHQQPGKKPRRGGEAYR